MSCGARRHGAGSQNMRPTRTPVRSRPSTTTWPAAPRQSRHPERTTMTIQSAPVSAMNAPARPEPGRVVVVPGTGLQFPQRLPFDAWLAVGRQLSAVASSSAWCLGDWLAYGQQAYGGRYREAVE